MSVEMPSYRVVWEIDIYAANKIQAAREALKIQMDPDSTAVVFKVDGQEIDLGMENDLRLIRKTSMND